MSELKTTSLSHKDNATGTPNITMYPDGTTSIGLTHTGGFKNQLINGDFRVWARGLSWGDGSGYRTDHWEGGGTGNGPVSKVTNTLGGSCPNAFSWGGSVSTTLTQPVELAEVGNMAPFVPSSTWTLSFLQSGTVSSVSLSFNDGSGNFNAGEKIVNDVTPTSLGGNRYSLTFTIPSDQTIASSRTNLGVRFNKNTLDTILLTAVQLEPGPVATPFEIIPIGTELALCQRYFEVGRTKTWVGGAAGGGITVSTQYKVTKRAIATLFYGTTTGFQFLPSTTESNYVEGFAAQKTGSGEIAFTWSADAEL